MLAVVLPWHWTLTCLGTIGRRKNAINDTSTTEATTILRSILIQMSPRHYRASASGRTCVDHGRTYSYSLVNRSSTWHHHETSLVSSSFRPPSFHKLDLFASIYLSLPSQMSLDLLCKWRFRDRRYKRDFTWFR